MILGGCLGRDAERDLKKEFREWIEKNKGKHKDIVADKNGVFLKIKDEEEIFEIADSYLDAVAEGNVKKYWETF